MLHRVFIMKSYPLRYCQQSRGLSMIPAYEAMSLPFHAEPKLVPPQPPKETILKNGIKVTTKGQIHAVVDLKFSIAAGSIHETASTKGCAHYLKNIAFVGTANKSSIRLTRELETVGAVFSSSADREQVSVSARVLSDKLEKAFEILSETITSPPKSLYLVSEAKDKAQLDYGEYLSSPEKQLDELIHEVAFGEESAYGSSFYADSVDDVIPESVLKFREERFTSPNLSVSLNGVPHETAVALTECYFLNLPNRQPLLDSPSPLYLGGSLRVKANVNGATYAGLAFPIDSKDADYYGLYQSLTYLISKRGLSKGAITPFYTPYSKGGLIGFFCGGTASSVSENLQAAVLDLKQIASSQVDLKSVLKQASLNLAIARDDDDFPGPVSSASLEQSLVVNAAVNCIKSKPTYISYGKTIGAPNISTVTQWLTHSQ